MNTRKCFFTFVMYWSLDFLYNIVFVYTVCIFILSYVPFHYIFLFEEESKSITFIFVSIMLMKQNNSKALFVGYTIQKFLAKFV